MSPHHTIPDHARSRSITRLRSSSAQCPRLGSGGRASVSLRPSRLSEPTLIIIQMGDSRRRSNRDLQKDVEFSEKVLRKMKPVCDRYMIFASSDNIITIFGKNGMFGHIGQ